MSFAIAALMALAHMNAYTGGDMGKANYALWTESVNHKVLKTDPIGKFDSIEIRAARNEHEPFQIALRAGRVPLESVDVKVGEFTGKHGKIPTSAISVFVPNYIYLPRLNNHYPDPLPPYSKPFDMGAGQTRSIWIDVYVPNDTKPGDYETTVIVKPANAEPKTAKVKLHVYNFTLPGQSKLTTAFGIGTHDMARSHGVEPNSAEARALHKKYYEFLLDRGISTYEIPADIFSDEGAKYLTDPRMTSFMIPLTFDEAEQRKILDRIRSLGAWDKGFFYPIDEPVKEDAYNTLKERCNYLRKIDPAVNIVSPYYANPDFVKDKTVYDLLTGYLNIWCFNTVFFDADAIDTRRKSGDKIWSYVCCGPGRPYANFFVDFAPLEHRLLTWQNYFYDVTGLLYWSTTYWIETKDVWENVATWGGLYGDGSLLYPGSKVGIDGPVSSIRLEVIRQGLEDYNYLWLLEQKAGRDRVLTHVKKLVTSWKEYSRDPALFEAVRDEIAREIESAL